MLNETLAILKLTSKFCNAKDHRESCKHVQIIKDMEKDTVNFYACNGYIAIKVTRPGVFFDDHSNLPSQLTINSIVKSVKVNDIGLLSAGNEDIKFPDYERVFNNVDATNSNAFFDCKYLALIFQSLETFRKDIKMMIAKLEIKPSIENTAWSMNTLINADTTNEIKIEIRIMPLRY